MMSGVAVLVAFLGIAQGFKIEPKAGCQFSHSFQSAGQQAYLQSPNWPSSYPNNADCKYSLSSPAGTQISMNCTEFNVEYASGCAYDKMTISLSGDANLRDGTVICGQGTFSRISQSNGLVVSFKSDSSNPLSRTPFRFQCLLTVVGTEAPTQPPTTVAPAPTAASGSFSDKSCTCGTRNEGSRIVGGTNAGVNEFPWRVAMYSPNLGVFCGATVISPNYVMTAAHCTAALKGDDLYADVGDHDLSTTSEATNQLIKCKRVIQHAQYDNQTQDNDMALCELETPVSFSRTVQPACLPWTMAGESFQGKSVTASGWGTTSSGGSSSHILKKVDLPVKTTEECRQYYDDAITDNMICTYSAGKDTCQGDSGGSIDYKEPNSGRYFAIGVVSWGVGCAGVNQPGVYAKVGNYLSWIQSNTNGETFCQ